MNCVKSRKTSVWLTFQFAEVERHFFDGKVDVERSDLFSEDEEMLYEK